VGIAVGQSPKLQAEADALNARIQLYQAMGGGWSLAAIAEIVSN
jgi:outer membrane protein TolC